MKKIIKKIHVYILAFMVFSCSLMSTYLTVCATSDDTTHGGGGHQHGATWETKFWDFIEDAEKRSAYILSQMSAIGNGDFEQICKNRDDMMAMFYNDDGTINTDKVTYDETTDTITMDISSLLNTFSSQIGLTVVPKNKGVLTGDSIIFRKVVEKAYSDNENFLLSFSQYPSSPGWIVFAYLIDTNSYYLVGSGSEYIVAYDKVTLQKSDNAFIRHGYGGNGRQAFEIDNSQIDLDTNGYILSASKSENYMSFTELRDEYLCNVSFSYWNDVESLSKFLKGSTYLGSSFGQNSIITIPVSDLTKDWETAYNTIVKNLDEIKESTGERPTQDQIDDAIKKVLGELEDIGGDIGDIGGDIEDVAKTLDDIYKLLDEFYSTFKELNALLSGGGGNEGDVSASLAYLKQISESLSRLDEDYKQSNSAILSELEEVTRILSETLYTDEGTDIADAVSHIDTALQDLTILMQDRVLSLLEDLSNSSAEISGTAVESNEILGRIEDILASMSGNDIDTSKLEEALEKIQLSIAETGSTSNENLSGMKDLLSDMQEVLIEIKSGMASQSDYTEILSDIHSLLEDMYKVQKLGTALDVADLLVDFADLLDNGNTSFLDRMGTSFSNVANASKEHFPTSIPWDLVAVFTAFSAESAVPSFDLPFYIPSLGINETVSIDLSGFEQLSKISRALLSALFVLLLIHLTRRSTAPDEGSG